MSGYHRISKLKNCIGSLKNVKHITKLNDSLAKKINAICNKTKIAHDLNGHVEKVKELNQILSREFNNVILKRKSGSDAISKNPKDCGNRLEENCKSLCSIPSSNVMKNEEQERKYLTAKYIKKEAEKLCQHLSKRPVFGSTLAWSATALSLKDDNSPPAVDSTSSAASAASQPAADAIPEPPPVPDWTAEALNQLNALGEPTFASLGLGGWTPVGWVQNCFEYLHITLGIDWWVAIVLGTLIIRICMFPLVILAQRNGAKMNNYLPQMQAIQMKLTEARQTGDALNAARYSQELMVFMNEKGLNPLKNMLVPLVQAPIFVSFFMGLRQMTNVPVESLRHGGIFWFQDLTLPDQYFLLPIITSATLYATIELGTDGAKISAHSSGQLVKYGLRALPVVILPFTVNFPGAILCYWVSSNFISLAQVAFLRIPTVRNYFKIEAMINHKPEQLPAQQKGFREGLKESWTNMKITRELEERRRLDEIQFRKAGKGPIQKTFKYDPTKQTSPNSNAPMSAKER